MKAAVLDQIGKVSVREVPEAKLQEAGDVLVRVTTAGICGSDLHIVHGRDPGIRMGTIMGHEFVGIIEDCGTDAGVWKSGDRVLSPFTINCGKCFYCMRNLPGRCLHSFCFGFVNEDGDGLQGSQAQLVRVPLSASTLLKVPDQKADGSPLEDEEVLFLGDIFSTAYSTAEGAQIQAGDTVVVVGCGPVGLLCILAARLFNPSSIVAVDTVDYRLEKAREFGAIVAHPNSELSRQVLDLTEGRGADAVLEAVGNPSALDLAIQMIRPAGIVSIAGYHTEALYELPIQKAYTKNLTLRIGRCHARKYMEKLLPLVLENKVPLKNIITHTMPLADASQGYEIFGQKRENAIKVLLKTP